MSLTDVLPNRPLTRPEADRLRDHPRVSQLGTIPFKTDGQTEIPVMLVRIDNLTHVLSFVGEDRPDKWESEGAVPDLSREAFEHLIGEIAKDQGVDVVERDKAGNERPYSP